MSDLTNKVAVVTGGNSGIGYSTAQEFKARGARVFITGRNQEKLSKAAESLGVEAILADQSNLGHLDKLVAQVKEKVDGVDILFVNAGVFLPTPLGNTTEEAFDTQLNINFKGAVFTIEKFLPLLKEGASIINLSSINAYMGMAMTSIYSATKAALDSYTRAASTELAPRNIRINSVNPGPIATEIFAKTGMPEEQLQGMASALENRVPLKKFGTPEAIAKLVSFLASDDAWYITGGEYTIDGGMNINPGPVM